MPYLNCRARPYYHGAALCFTLPACLATDSDGSAFPEEFAFPDFFFCKVWHLDKALIISTGYKCTDEAHYKN